MKHAIRLGFLLASLLAVSAQAPLGKAERLFMFGADYVRVDQWARANGGQLRWTSFPREARVVLPSGTLTFSADSRRITLRGVQTWLSAPVVARGSALYAAAIDFNTTIHPLLFPAKAPAGHVIRTIVLDPGHGGRDPGNKEGRRVEKDFTLVFSREVRDLLAKAGFQVHLTRNTDTLVDLDLRPVLAKQRRADLFLSLHFNSADGPGGSAVKGAEVYCFSPAWTASTNDRMGSGHKSTQSGNRHDTRNIQLAWQLQKALVERAGCEDRGVKRARYAVLKSADMPAVLIEAAFMTNPFDARKIYEPSQRRVLAQAIVDGVLAYKRLIERQQPVSNSK